MSSRPCSGKDVDGRDEPGHDERVAQRVLCRAWNDIVQRAPHPVLSLESRPVQARKKRLVSMLRPGTFALTALLAALSATGPLTTDMYLPSLPDIARQLNGSTAGAVHHFRLPDRLC